MIHYEIWHALETLSARGFPCPPLASGPCCASLPAESLSELGALGLRETFCWIKGPFLETSSFPGEASGVPGNCAFELEFWLPGETGCWAGGLFSGWSPPGVTAGGSGADLSRLSMLSAPSANKKEKGTRHCNAQQ